MQNYLSAFLNAKTSSGNTSHFMLTSVNLICQVRLECDTMNLSLPLQIYQFPLHSEVLFRDKLQF